MKQDLEGMNLDDSNSVSDNNSSKEVPDLSFLEKSDFLSNPRHSPSKFSRMKATSSKFVPSFSQPLVSHSPNTTAESGSTHHYSDKCLPTLPPEQHFQMSPPPAPTGGYNYSPEQQHWSSQSVPELQPSPAPFPQY